MGSPMLILRLEGPLQSWGLRAQWDVRDTGDEPSKSGIVGLLGCALGYTMHDPRLIDLDRRLQLGVRVEQPGSLLTDFHTVSGVMATAEGGVKGSADDPSTIISRRTYLQDAAFLVVLSGPAELLEVCGAALQAPVWPVYLGRKACPPSRPVFERLTTDYDSLVDALRGYPWELHWPVGAKRTPERRRIVWEDPDGEFLRPDRVQANPARMYASRAVRMDMANFPGAVERGEPMCT